MGKKSRAEASLESEASPSSKRQRKTSENGDAEEAATNGDGGDQSMASLPADLPYSEKLQFASAIAHPIAGKKLTKKLLKLVKKSYQNKGAFRSGLRDVQTRIRKGERGLVILAADVTPIDVMSHIPGICEELDIPYVYVPLRSDISNAMGVKRPTLMALVVSSPTINLNDEPYSSYAELYQECVDAVKALHEE